MEKIIEYFRAKNLDYEKYSQQDCFQFILLILDNISGNYPKLLQFFSLYYKYKCNKCKSTVKRKDYILFNETIRCENCPGIMTICYISVPKCIMTANSSKNPEGMKRVNTV